jgi:hypothetical protein
MPFIASTDEEFWGCPDEYTTRDEAVAALADEHESKQVFWSGIKILDEVPILDEGWVDDMLEKIDEDMERHSDLDAWPDTKKPMRKELAAEMNAVFHAWVTRHDLAPTSYHVENVQRHDRPEKGDGGE